jgi:FixJ family two-component response regulator
MRAIRERQSGMPEQIVRVAVVDDDISVCRALGRLLHVNGLSVDTYSSPGEFLESLAHVVPDCLVVDMHMPEMSGLELIQALGARGFAMPVIVITGHDIEEMRERCLAQGAAAYLVKPLRDGSLLRSIRVAVGQ